MKVHDRHDDDCPGSFPKKDAKGEGLCDASADIKLKDGVKAGIQRKPVYGILNGG